MGLTKRQKQQQSVADLCRQINPRSEIARQIDRRIRRTEMRKSKIK